MTDQPRWVRCTVEDFHAVRRGIPVLRQRAFDELGERGWYLTFQGEPVAKWIARGVSNEVRVRVR